MKKLSEKDFKKIYKAYYKANPHMLKIKDISYKSFVFIGEWKVKLDKDNIWSEKECIFHSVICTDKKAKSYCITLSALLVMISKL